MNVGTIIRAVTDLPARLFGGNAQTVEVSGLDYTLHLDLEKLPPFTPVAPVDEAPGKWTVIWDEITNTYKRVEFTNLPPPIGSLGLDEEEVDDRVAQLLKAGNNVAIVYDDNGNRLTIHSIAPGGSTGPQNVFDTIHDGRLATIPAAVKNVMLMGYDKPGDAGPPMPSRRTAAMVTAHKGVWRSADRYTDAGVEDFANGGWWEYVATNQPVYIEWFGGKADFWVPESRIAGSNWFEGRPPVNPTPTDNWQAIIDASKFFFTHIGYNVLPRDTEGLPIYGAGPGTPMFSAGPTIQIGTGGYFCSQTLRFDRHLTMKGLGFGVYHDYHVSQIYFPPGVKGIFAGSQGENGLAGGAVVLENIFFSGGHLEGVSDAHGLEMHATCSVRECAFQGFSGHGIEVAGNVPQTNANIFDLFHVTCYGNKRSGVHCIYGDSNAGTGIALNVMENGEWGIDDYSFLGNYWFGHHASYNALGDYRGIGGGGQRCTFVACYSEGQANPSVINAPAIWVGGYPASGLAGDGYKIDGNVVHGTHQLHNPDPANQIGIVNLRYPNNVQRISVPGGTEYLYKWNAGQGLGYQIGDAVNQHIWFIADYANTHTAGRAEPVDWGAMVAPWGVYIGDVWNETRQVGTTNAAGWNFNASFFQGSTLSQFARSKCYAIGDMLADYNGDSRGILFCTRAGGYGVNWIAGRGYTPDDANAHVHHIVTNSAGRTYRCVGPAGGGGPASVEPVHLSGVNAPTADGYLWKFLSDQRAVFKQTLLMGQEGTTVNDPRVAVAQTWNNAAVQFACNHTHVTDTASHADSDIENWYVNGAKKAALRKDGVFLSNGVPVVMATELDELRATIAALQDRIATLETRHAH